MVHSTVDNFLFINIFCSEFHHSKAEIKALLFHPESFYPRHLNPIEKMTQQKGLLFSDILAGSLGAALPVLRSPLKSGSRAQSGRKYTKVSAILRRWSQTSSWKVDNYK